MEMIMENGQVLQLMFDESSIEIAHDPILKYAFNKKMEGIYHCIGTITFTSDLKTYITADNIIRAVINTEWLKSRWYNIGMQKPTVQYYDYITKKYFHINCSRSFISMVIAFLRENSDQLQINKNKDRFVCVILLKS